MLNLISVKKDSIHTFTWIMKMMFHVDENIFYYLFKLEIDEKNNCEKICSIISH